MVPEAPLEKLEGMILSRCISMAKLRDTDLKVECGVQNNPTPNMGYLLPGIFLTRHTYFRNLKKSSKWVGLLECELNGILRWCCGLGPSIT